MLVRDRRHPKEVHPKPSLLAGYSLSAPDGERRYEGVMGVGDKLLDFVLVQNARFVSEREEPLSKLPAKRVAIFTCMDTRLVEFLEQAMGLKRGDAMIIKNAGNTLIDPEGGVIRSLLVAIFILGCQEIFVIGHLDCGMAQINETELEKRMLERGVPASAIASLEPSLKEWVGAFHDPRANVVRVVQMLRKAPLIPADVPIHGLIFDPHRGHLELLDHGSSETAG